MLSSFEEEKTGFQKALDSIKVGKKNQKASENEQQPVYSFNDILEQGKQITKDAIYILEINTVTDNRRESLIGGDSIYV